MAPQMVRPAAPSSTDTIELADMLQALPEQATPTSIGNDPALTAAVGRYIARPIRRGISFFGCDMISTQSLTLGMSMPASIWIGLVLEGSWNGRVDGVPLAMDADLRPRLLGFGENAECLDCHRMGGRTKMASFHIDSSFFDHMPGACSSFAELRSLMVRSSPEARTLPSLHLAEAFAGLLTCPFHGALEALHFESVSLMTLVESARISTEAPDRQSLPTGKAMAQSARDAIDADLGGFQSVETLARALSTNETSLRKAFKATYGITISGYVLDRRMQAAQLLLRETDLHIAQIAYRVGYRDPGNFATAYRRLFGHTPSEDRPRNQGKVVPG